ncbi:helix-turn-helix domain-containing protein [Parabacteroides sp. GYB001]|uniref:helix-turn-helix domain-containing protein n=1 Tax=Parabacteroides leei TaxID=2939491 RepID=UPI00201808B3|nr:helix-turn-helix domain-containing protein [Parabacteroides leei]MCL3852179.1 helix-turn-helix domain-containing protein [Parabacteroides leei]
MEENMPIFDIPTDFIASDNITGEILKRYVNYSSKMKAVLFALCVKGKVRITLNLSEHTIKQNDFLTLTPDSFIQINEVSQDAHFYYACFSREFMDSNNLILTTIRLLPMLTEYPVINLSEDLTQLYLDVFKPLLHAYSLPCTLENKDIIKSIFTIFIQGTAELYKNHGKWKNPFHTRSKEICREFTKLVMSHYTTQRNVAFYAEHLGVTVSHFCSTIKKETGKTALEIITAIVLMDIKAQLKSTDLPTKEIAFSLGFNNMSFFNRYFKRHTGMTPQEFRNS